MLQSDLGSNVGSTQSSSEAKASLSMDALIPLRHPSGQVIGLLLAESIQSRLLKYPNLSEKLRYFGEQLALILGDTCLKSCLVSLKYLDSSTRQYKLKAAPGSIYGHRGILDPKESIFGILVFNALPVTTCFSTAELTETRKKETF